MKKINRKKKGKKQFEQFNTQPKRMQKLVDLSKPV